MPRRPNIILTVADDQRFDLLSLLGRIPCATPNLDRLADRGVCYSHAFHMGSTHPAVCAPSRAMLHTGLSLFDIPDAIQGGWAFPSAPPATNPEDVPLLGELLRRSGYRTVGVGKWHNGTRAFARSFAAGDAIFHGGMHDHFATPVHDFHAEGKYPAQRATVRQGHSTEVFVEAAIRLLREHALVPSEPLFLYVAFTAPHDPRTTLPRWHEQYPADRVELPPNFLPEHPFDNGELRIRDELLAAFPRTGDEIRRHIADYYAMTSHLDDAIGRLHRAAEALGLADDTVFVHTADHGLAVGQHGLMGKQNLYDHSVRVPLLVAGPGFDRGRTDDRLCYMHDLFPTLLTCAGVPVPASCAFARLDSTPRDSIFSAYRDCQRMVRDRRWKLIEYRVGGRKRAPLFDLAADPWEQHDRAADPVCASPLHHLRDQLSRWRARVNDPSLKTR